MRFAKAIALVTRNGRIAGRFARTIFNMFLETKDRNRTSIAEPGWTFLPRFAIISAWGRLTLPTGNSSKLAMYRPDPGAVMATTTIS